MSRITVQSLEKSYGGEELFIGLSFEAAEGMRLAVAGPNGAGKSTLLKLMAGELRPDGGEVTTSRGAMVGYVAQTLGEDALSQPLLAWVLSALPSWGDLWSRWEEAAANNDQGRMEKLSAEQHEFEVRFGYNPEHKARTILTGLGFAEDDLLKRVGELSGGWRERAKLGRVLLQGADVLLLDEPTNHLDLEAVEWLESYLLAYKGALVFVAHDKVFLERVGTHVLYLAGGRSVLRKGSFAQYQLWEQEQASLRGKEIAKLEEKIASEMDYIRRFRVKARKAAQAQSKIKRVEKMQIDLGRLKEEQQAAAPLRTLSFTLPEPKRAGRAVLNVVGLEFAYDNGQRVWPTLDFQLFRGRKVALAAPNGAGKTTLLKLLVGDLKPHAGDITLGANVQMAYFSQQQHEILRTGNTVLGELRRLSAPDLNDEQLMGTLGLFMLGEKYFERSVADLSGGEKNRLVLASLFTARANFLVLDEPTNHLDIDSRIGLISALKKYEGTILFVAHDRHLLSEVAEEIWSLGPLGIEVHTGGFAEYAAKRREETAAGTDGRPQETQTEAKAQVRDRAARQADKRQAAEARNKLYRVLKPKKSEYDKLEADLDKAMAETAELEEALADPSVYEAPDKALKLNSRYQDAQAWSEELLEKLEALEAEITALTREHEEKWGTA